MPTIDIENLPVHYLELGAPDQPPLVLVHGLLGDASTVAPLAERLAAHFRVLTPDALGHGRSARPAELTLEDQGAMLNGLVAALGYDRAVLVGISMGSYLAAQASILDPARTAALVLVVSRAHGLTSSSAAYAARQGYDLATLAPDDAVALLAGALWSDDTPEVRRDELLRTVGGGQQLTADEQAVIERSLARFDLRPGLASITAPTLVVSGADDGLNPPEAGRELADLVSGAEFRVYEHSGHMLAYEETDRLADDVVRFAGDA